ncbi:cytochrome-c oxidase [Priestia abyssalis]|uniref:cytochrome-c oxidase n=1 Tax=Priestia abyssalis TaxID=1221450 RepID=UPI000995D7B5|nr:cytochrome-c oxidase [Priestia abyssalis]
MGVRLIKVSAVYFAIGALLGFYMSIAHTYTLTPVHVHINLLGWTALTLAGIIYHVFPQAAATKAAKIHFWLHNIGLPIMMIALAFVVLGYEQLVAFTAIGGTITVIAVLFFVYNVLKNVK